MNVIAQSATKKTQATPRKAKQLEARRIDIREYHPLVSLLFSALCSSSSSPSRPSFEQRKRKSNEYLNLEEKRI